MTAVAPVAFGRLHVLPLVLAFLRRHPAAAVQLVLLDRVVSLVDEGLDVAIRARTVNHLVLADGRVQCDLWFPPTPIPKVGRFSVLADPQGAVFSVVEMAA